MPSCAKLTTLQASRNPESAHQASHEPTSVSIKIGWTRTKGWSKTLTKPQPTRFNTQRQDRWGAMCDVTSHSHCSDRASNDGSPTSSDSVTKWRTSPSKRPDRFQRSRRYRRWKTIPVQVAKDRRRFLKLSSLTRLSEFLISHSNRFRWARECGTDQTLGDEQISLEVYVYRMKAGQNVMWVQQEGYAEHSSAVPGSCRKQEFSHQRKSRSLHGRRKQYALRRTQKALRRYLRKRSRLFRTKNVVLNSQIAEKLPQQIAKFKEAFSLFDKDGDDTVDHQGSWAQSHSGTAWPSIRIWQRISCRTRSTKWMPTETAPLISRNSCLRWYQEDEGRGHRRRTRTQKKKASMTFKVFDRDGNGFICRTDDELGRATPRDGEFGQEAHRKRERVQNMLMHCQPQATANCVKVETKLNSISATTTSRQRVNPHK